MLGVTDIWTYVIGTVAIILLPGPNSMYVLSTAAAFGVRRGYQAACGVFLGDAIRRRRRLAAAGTSAIGALFLGFSLRLATASLS